jgi:tight adherence protein C
MEIFIALTMGAAVALVIAGVAINRQRPEGLDERLDRFGKRLPPKSLEEVELQQSFYDRAVKPLVEQASRISSRVTPAKSLRETELKLARAGYPNGWGAADFWGVRGLGAMIAGSLPLLLMLPSGATPGRLLFITGLFIALGFFLPNYWLDKKIKARQNEIQKALPDALDLMTVSVEAGLGFDSAIQKVSEKWENELSRAFERANSQMRIGRTRREALRDMAERVDVEDVTAFVAAILQADQLGVSMSKVLRIQSEQMRVRRRQRAEEQAQKAPIKMLFPMVFLIFPSLFIVLLGPAVIILMEQFGGSGGF